MPIYQTNNVSDTIKVGVWKITESEESLLSNYISMGYDEFSVYQTKNKQRLKQWFATRLLLRSFFKTINIVYDDFGKPHLCNGWHISISHSHDFVAIIINKNNPCGIDVEKVTPKIERIKHKFLNDEDLQTVVSLEHLILHWGAKEALYKYYGRKEVLFIEHLFIHNFNTNNDAFFGEIRLPSFNKKIPMIWGRIEDFVLVYTV